MHEITVAELIKMLHQIIDQNKPVRLWDVEYSISVPINDVDDRQDEIVLS